MDDSIRAFLRTIGRVPLLTKEQEIILGFQVQALMSLVAAKKTLAQQLHREPNLHEWALQVHLSEVELTETLKLGQQAKCFMVEANLRLVVAIAKRYRERGVEFLDLIQEGAIGLQRAVEKFDPSKNFRFSSYAFWWIRESITRAIRENSRSIHLPPHVYEKLNSIRKATKLLSQQLGRTPTIPEIAARLEMSPKQIRQCLEWAQPTLSLNQLVRDGSEDELGSLVPDKCATPDELLVQSSVTEELRQMMAKLTPLQTQVLSLRFGLVDEEELTFSEIGKKFNVSKQRVHQVAVKAIARMKPKNTAKPELPAPDALAALYADTMPTLEAEVMSANSAPDTVDIWEVILSDERITDANASELLLLMSEQSSSIE